MCIYNFSLLTYSLNLLHLIHHHKVSLIHLSLSLPLFQFDNKTLLENPIFLLLPSNYCHLDSVATPMIQMVAFHHKEHDNAIRCQVKGTTLLNDSYPVASLLTWDFQSTLLHEMKSFLVDLHSKLDPWKMSMVSSLDECQQTPLLPFCSNQVQTLGLIHRIDQWTFLWALLSWLNYSLSLHRKVRLVS